MGMGNVPSYFISFGLMSMLRSDKVGDMVKENADKLDSLIDAEFPKKSEEIQRTIVQTILLPLAKQLMKENPQEFINILTEEARRFQNEVSKDSIYL